MNNCQKHYGHACDTIPSPLRGEKVHGRLTTGSALPALRGGNAPPVATFRGPSGANFEVHRH